jgi:hypothetical protein
LLVVFIVCVPNFFCVLAKVLQYNATDIAFSALFLLYWKTATCMNHQILSQATFCNNYGKPATSDLLITYYLGTEVRSFVWNIADLAATQYITAKASKQIKNQIKRMTCTQVLTIKDWK